MATGIRQRIAELDGLRALAILWVMLYHALWGLHFWWSAPITTWGWAGVDLFFVISGYLITSILLSLRERGRGYFRTFYMRRVLRIFPPCYLVLAIYFLVSVLSGFHRLKPWVANALFLSAIFPDRLVRGVGSYAAFPVAVGVEVYWSLSVEEWFYVVWAPVVRWLSRPALWRCLLAIVVLTPLLRALISDQKVPYFFAPARADALAFGALLALLAAEGLLTAISGEVLAAVALSAAIGLLAWGELATGRVYQSRAFSLAGYTILETGLAAVVWYSLTRAGGPGLVRILRMRALRYIGVISYTLYLIHYPIIVLATAMTGNQWLGGLIGIVVAIALAAVSWHYFEQPILALKDRRYGSSVPLERARAAAGGR